MQRGKLVSLIPRTLLLAVALVAMVVAIGSLGDRKSRSASRRDAAPSTPTLAMQNAAPPMAARESPEGVSAGIAPVPPPAARAGSGHAPHAGARTVQTAGTAGMLVGIDPETGRPGRPSQAFREKAAGLMSPALDRSSEGLTVVTRPDGSKHVDLQGRFQNYTVVRLTRDGRKVEDCIEGPDVDAALHSDTAPAPALEEK